MRGETKDDTATPESNGTSHAREAAGVFLTGCSRRQLAGRTRTEEDLGKYVLLGEDRNSRRSSSHYSPFARRAERSISRSPLTKGVAARDAEGEESDGGKSGNWLLGRTKHMQDHFRDSNVAGYRPKPANTDIPGLTPQQLRPNWGKMPDVEESSLSSDANVSLTNPVEGVAGATPPFTQSINGEGETGAEKTSDQQRTPSETSQPEESLSVKRHESRNHVEKAVHLGNLQEGDGVEPTKKEALPAKHGIRLTNK